MFPHRTKLVSLALAFMLSPISAASADTSPGKQCNPDHTAQMELLMEDYRDAFNSHEVDEFAGVLAEDYWSVNPFGEFDGLQANLDLTAGMIAAFPDIHASIERVIVRGNQVVLEYSWVGTHLGEVMGIPATGRVVQVRATEIHEVEAGMIQRSWNYIDLFGLLAQLGAI
jgi:steroid delta-isomerase-like uncharacterized protein